MEGTCEGRGVGVAPSVCKAEEEKKGSPIHLVSMLGLE
jgi:hypothetical protein